MFPALFSIGNKRLGHYLLQELTASICAKWVRHPKEGGGNQLSQVFLAAYRVLTSNFFKICSWRISAIRLLRRGGAIGPETALGSFHLGVKWLSILAPDLDLIPQRRRPHTTNLKALEIWTAQTLCDIGILLSVVSFLLHIGRGYFERILGRFTLRVAADLWWVVYIVLRDGTLFLAAVIGFWNLNLDIMADIKVGLPFVPLGTVALAAALLIKVFRNAEDVNRSLRLSTWLVTLGAVLNTIGYVFVMEGPGEEYAASKTVFWQTLQSWRSNENPQLATFTFYLTFCMLAGLGAIAVVKAVQLYRTAEKEGAQNV